MTFRPQSKNKKPHILAIGSAVLAVVLFLASAFVPKFNFYYQASALILAVASLEIYMKYVGSDYVYDAGERQLKVYKVTGKKSICVCSLDYDESVTCIMKREEYEKDKEKYPKVNFNVNYAKNIFPKDYYVYMFSFNGKKSLMKFEPDEVFVNYANLFIDKALKNKEEE